MEAAIAKHHPRFMDLSGQRFGKLRVTTLRSICPTYWNCLCDCGNEKSIQAAKLKSGETKSCGCLRVAVHADRVRTHGQTGTPEHKAFIQMLKRCKHIDRYIERAPSVPWTFDEFLAEVGRRPGPTHTIDRRENSIGYERGNLRWATPAQQARNKSNTLWVEWLGFRLCMTDWSKALGYSPGPGVIKKRLKRMPIEQALSPRLGMSEQTLLDRLAAIAQEAPHE